VDVQAPGHFALGKELATAKLGQYFTIELFKVALRNHVKDFETLRAKAGQFHYFLFAVVSFSHCQSSR